MSSPINEKVKSLVSFIKEHAKEGDADSVIAAVDDYSSKNRSTMHIGDSKGKILDDVVLEINPTAALELGALFGYSAIRIAKLLKPGAKLYSLEIDQEAAEISKSMIAFAGLSSRVEVVHGTSSEILRRFAAGEFPFTSFDFVLVDHWKDCYKPDLILMEKHKLVRKGTVLLADNIFHPGVPDYAEYVRNSTRYECTTYSCKISKPPYKDEMLKSLCLFD